MNKKEIIAILMNIIYPKFRNDWYYVKQCFDRDFKMEITKEEWENYLNENTLDGR